VRIEEDGDFMFCLIDEHEFGFDQPRPDFFFPRPFRFTFLRVSITSRELKFRDGPTRSGDFALAAGVGAGHNGSTEPFGCHLSPCGGEADRQAVAGGDEFEHRRGRARAGGHEQQRQDRDQPDSVELTTPKKPAYPRLLWRS